MVAYLVRVETEKAGGFRERPIFGQDEKKSKTFCGKSFTLIASGWGIDAKYQKEHFTHLMYPTKTATLWSKSVIDC